MWQKLLVDEVKVAVPSIEETTFLNWYHADIGLCIWNNQNKPTDIDRGDYDQRTKNSLRWDREP